jgi:hypothetical protein
MANRLVPCPSCTRHVKVTSTSCPFCGDAVPEAHRARERRAFVGPMTRAALTFGGVATAVMASACSASQALYGAFVPDAAYGSPDDASSTSSRTPATPTVGDAAARDDANAKDGGAHDGTLQDATSPHEDAASAEAGATEAGAPDQGAPDAANEGAAPHPDAAGAPDAASVDAGHKDAGDAG